MFHIKTYPILMFSWNAVRRKGLKAFLTFLFSSFPAFQPNISYVIRSQWSNITWNNQLLK